MRATVLRGFAVAWMLALGGSAPAGVIYDNGIYDAQNAQLSDFDATFMAYQAADGFSFASQQVIQEVRWWGAYWADNTPTAPDNFTIRFFDGAPGSPGALLAQYIVGAVPRADTGDDIIELGLDIYGYMAPVPGLTLSTGTYFMSIANNTAADPGDDWFWATSSSAAGSSWGRSTDQAPWEEWPLELAFQLRNGEVPEPCTLALLGLGLAALCRRRRRP